MTGPSELGTVRAVVCDDEPLARAAISEYLRDVEWIEVVGAASDGSEAVRLIHKLEPDIVFLDVRMPGLSGIEVLDALEHRPAVVFTTAFDEYALPAFEHGAVDYLVKPFGRERLVRTLDRLRVRLVGEARAASEAGPGGPVKAAAGTWAERVFARHRGAMVPITVDQIRRAEAVDGGVKVHLESRVFDLDCTMSEIERRLNPADFVRVHRAHLVNLAFVTSIRRYDERRLILTIDDGTTVVASRAGSHALRALME